MTLLLLLGGFQAKEGISNMECFLTLRGISQNGSFNSIRAIKALELKVVSLNKSYNFSNFFIHKIEIKLIPFKNYCYEN